MTLPEVLLWRALRERPAGLRFRRQHPAGKYVLDFYCPAKKLAVEVDGEAHGRGNQPMHDEARDAWLVAQGVTVLRVTAKDVLADLAAVVLHITSTCSPAARYPSTACGGPPPPPGEE